MSIPDETLMAYADGTLAPEEATRVARGVAADPVLAERLGQLRAGGEAARGAFAGVLQEPVPDRLLAVLQRSAPQAPVLQPVPAADPPPRTAPPVTPPSPPALVPRPGRLRPRLAIAASLLLGLVGGWALRGSEADGGPGRVGPALAAALETQPSNAGTGAVRLLGSHALADGGICRIFALPDGEAALTGLACRDMGGPWRVAALVARRGGTQGFTPAGAEDPLVAEVLERRGAGPAMDAATERAAIARGWRGGG
jgi:anti-sigma factor RsiW